MKTLISKSIIFIALLIVCVILISKLEYYKKKPLSNYMSAIEFKHARVDSFNESQIIFIGGSSLTFGLNSKTIQDSIKLPVTNLGLNAALGYDFIFNEARSIIKPNQILIISLELGMDKEGMLDLKYKTCRYFPDACNYFTITKFQIIKQKIARVFKNFQMNINYFIWLLSENKTSTIYLLESFNQFGDIVENIDNDKKINCDFIFGNQNERAKDIAHEINKLADFCSKIGVICYYTPCPIHSTYYENNKGFFESYLNIFKSELKIKMIGDFETYVLPDSLFFDTEYHLTKKGAQLRTDLLIDAMKEIDIK